MSHAQRHSGFRFPFVSPISSLVIGVSVCLSGVLGCSGNSGPELFSISGSVSLDGAELKQGSITFVPTEGTTGPSGGAEIKDGVYAVPKEKGLAAGKYRVEIHAIMKTGKKVEVGSPSPPGTMMDEIKEAIPARYNTNSTLEAEVTGNQEGVDFDLSTK